ncbi:MAG: DUF1566 domain-containing protein [Bacteroidaceae bacterium]|nr:DUF1566 domain-containing protein [Bacteroidaceae bacterium]
MSTDANKEALLLRLNKEMQVEAMHEIGFTEVTFETPLSEIAEYIKWAGGLRDLRIACVKIADGTMNYFTGEEWAALTANAKAQYSKLGVCIRARKREFIVAAADCVNSSGGYTFKFGAYGTDLKGVANYGAGNVGLYDITTGKEDTLAAIEQTAGTTDTQGITGAPAAEAAWNYKANSNDPLQWYLPSIAELRLICEFKTEINAFLTKYFSGGTFAGEWYWSSTEHSSTSSWHVNMYNGNSNNGIRGNSNRVRAVSFAK